MSHWLEEAEREELLRRQRPTHDSAKIQDKIFRINKNYEINGQAYDKFIEILHDVCERANHLPSEKREPWNHIEIKSKESKLNNHLFTFTTDERIDKVVTTSRFPFFKRQHFKHIRHIYFAVSKEMGKCEIEVKDDYLAKTRLNLDDGKEFDRPANDGFQRVNVIFMFDIENLTKEIAIKILDWLAFKNDLKSLPFGEEHFKTRKRG